MVQTVVQETEKPMKITFNRQRTPIKIFVNGLKSGEIFRGAGRRNYILNLDHICWREGKPSENGPTCMGFHTVREAKAAALEHAPKIEEFRIRHMERRVAGEGDDPDSSWYA